MRKHGDQDDARVLVEATTVGMGDLETVVTPTFEHLVVKGQLGHLGAGPVQTYLPKGSTNRLMEGRYAVRRMASSAVRVCSVVLVAT